MREEFIGRRAEMEALGAFLQRDRPSVGVIYGRRRIGKSLLIRKALEGRKGLFFEGLENRPKREQIKAFVFELVRQTGLSPGVGTIGTWRQALALLEPVLRKEPACVVFDEFQHNRRYGGRPSRRASF
jgi:AAA+ ATPase superfamily predicted ATPase